MDITPNRGNDLEPRGRLPAAELEQIVQTALGSRRVSAIHPLTDGYRNANFKVEFANSSEPVVLRLYEHDPMLCRKEVDIIRLLSGSVPVPEIIYAQPDAKSPNLQRRVKPELCDQVHELMWRSAPELAELDLQTHLVHSDCGHRNLLVQRIDGRWKTAAVLDWEFAISYSPLADIGHFLLRHERRSMDVIEPAFIKGYLDGGGSLPEDWRRLARLVDLTAVCEGLTHADLPEAALNELLALLNSGTGA